MKKKLIAFALVLTMSLCVILAAPVFGSELKNPQTATVSVPGTSGLEVTMQGVYDIFGDISWSDSGYGYVSFFLVTNDAVLTFNQDVRADDNLKMIDIKAGVPEPMGSFREIDVYYWIDDEHWIMIKFETVLPDMWDELTYKDGNLRPIAEIIVAADTSQPQQQTQPSDEVTVLVNGKAPSFDVPPRIVNGRTLVPLRAIFEEMGAEIEYDGATQTVTATKEDTVVVLTIGDTSPTINGVIVSIDQPGIIVDGRTLAPLRFVAEAFGGSVEWNGDTRTAAITQ